MENPSKQRKLSVEIIVLEESSGDRVCAEVGDVSVEIIEDDVLSNNNNVSEEETEGSEEDEDEDSDEEE